MTFLLARGRAAAQRGIPLVVRRVGVSPGDKEKRSNLPTGSYLSIESGRCVRGRIKVR